MFLVYLEYFTLQQMRSCARKKENKTFQQGIRGSPNNVFSFAEASRRKFTRFHLLVSQTKKERKHKHKI